MNQYLLLSTLNLSLGGLVFLLGFVILRENPGNRLNRVVALMLFFGGLGAILGALSFMAARAVAPGAAATTGVLENLSYVWEFFFPALFLFASLFPEERPFVRAIRLPGNPSWSPGFGALLFAPHVFHFALMLLLLVWKPGFSVPEVGPLKYAAPVVNIAGVFVGLFLLVHQSLFSLVNLGFGLATMALLFDSLRRAQVPRIRQQLRAIALGLSACLVAYSVSTFIPQLLNLEIPATWRASLQVAALTLGPGSIAYAIVAHKFLDARLLARRAILYALASAALVGLYLLVLAPAQSLLRAAPGFDPRVLEPVLLVIALVLFQPALARLEEMLDRMLLRDPSDYRNVLRQLGSELQTTIDLEVLLSRTIRTLADALLLRRAHIVAFTRDGMVAHAGAGEALTDAHIARLRAVLPRVHARTAVHRTAEPIEGLRPEERAFVARDLGMELLVPLAWRADLVGAILLGPKLTGTRFTSEDVQLLQSLAGQVSVSLQNGLLLRDRVAVARFEQELNLARQIQRESLLSEFPPVPRCDVHAVYIPSRQVGGDFYDVVEDANGAHLVAIADVSGKGVPAALLSSMLQASLRTLAGTGEPLARILAHMNALLYRSTAHHQFATFFLARVDGARLALSFSNAGHNWPVVVRPNGERVFLERGGAPLGILEDMRFEEGQVDLAPGDRVVLYTDGISEATNADGEQFGEARLCAYVSSLPLDLPARDVAERVIAHLREFLDGVEAQDDITLLVLRVVQPSPAVAGGGVPAADDRAPLPVA
uniref:PPM-type phosphatase domain-containing protein n=1 Tax=Eiseniibacteriota bacterium TaxID=2212470 RepID=A0A832I116_UNCEI